jgi:hypothetical protein
MKATNIHPARDMTLPLLGLQAELMTFDPAANSQTV